MAPSRLVGVARGLSFFGVVSLVSVGWAGCADDGALHQCMASGGAGVGPPHLVFAQPVYDLGSPIVGNPSGLAIAVTNAGAAPTGTVGITITPGRSFDFAVDASCCEAQPLAPGATCFVIVTFTPIMAGPQSATLTVSADPGAAKSVMLSGNGMDLQDG